MTFPLEYFKAKFSVISNTLITRIQCEEFSICGNPLSFIMEASLWKDQYDRIYYVVLIMCQWDTSDKEYQ